MTRLRLQIAARLLLALLLLPALHAACAQQPNQPLPIITGTRQSSADAPETNNELEKYAHSPAVARIARKMGISTTEAARIFEDFNSGLLILAILYYLVRVLPGKFRQRRQRLAQELTDARRAGDEARDRMARIEEKLNALGGEVEALRAHAAEILHADQHRIHAGQEEERRRIVRMAEAEIAAAQANAERGLKRFASDLAVERAAARVQLTPEGDQALIDEFLHGLAAQLSREGSN